MSEQSNDARHLGILRVSHKLLIQALGLPPDTDIDAVQIAIDIPGAIELRVEQSELPLSASGSVIPRITAELKREEVEGQAYETRFVRWVL